MSRSIGDRTKMHEIVHICMLMKRSGRRYFIRTAVSAPPIRYLFAPASLSLTFNILLTTGRPLPSKQGWQADPGLHPTVSTNSQTRQQNPSHLSTLKTEFITLTSCNRLTNLLQKIVKYTDNPKSSKCTVEQYYVLASSL